MGLSQPRLRDGGILIEREMQGAESLNDGQRALISGLRVGAVAPGDLLERQPGRADPVPRHLPDQQVTERGDLEEGEVEPRGWIDTVLTVGLDVDEPQQPRFEVALRGDAERSGGRDLGGGLDATALVHAG
ncbi:MAG: hypothetical protein IPN17_10875 [Deltaproteobacteria bacterium]|nr:hypothetical protein [Deltaproteobacteria bacterium]